MSRQHGTYEHVRMRMLTSMRMKMRKRMRMHVHIIEWRCLVREVPGAAARPAPAWRAWQGPGLR